MDQTLNEIRENAREAQQALVTMLDGASDQALFHEHDQENWSLAVMLSHLIEARGFFVKQSEQFDPNADPLVGRTLDNEQRAEAILHAQRNQVSREELRQNLVSSHEAVMKYLSGVDEATFATPCTHMRFGPITFGNFLQRTFVEHEQAHVQQARGYLNQA
jgi:hypothetical protein